MAAADRSLTVRKLELDLQVDAPRFWWGGRPFETHWFDALSLGLPDAEHYANDCVKAVIPLVSDPALVAQARGFIGQEASHSFLHTRCNAVLERRGVRPTLVAYKRWRLSLAHWLHTLSGMAVTVSWEHFTAITCQHTLQRTDFVTEAAEPFRALWMWHCAEELEHHCLAFDLYQAAGGAYWRRIFWYLYGSGLFASDFGIQTLANMYRGGSLWSPRVWWGAVRYFFGRRGLFWFALPRWVAFLRPGFHPSRYTDHSLVERTLGALASQLREVSRPRAEGT